MAGITRMQLRPLSVLVALTLVSLALAGCGAGDASANPKKDPFAALMGTWMVDMDATMERARSNPDLSPEQLEQMPGVIEKMMNSMTLEMTPEAMVTKMGERERKATYTVKSTAPNNVVLAVKSGMQSAECTFELLPDSRMRYTSSATNDMDHYVWMRKPVEQAQVPTTE